MVEVAGERGMAVEDPRSFQIAVLSAADGCSLSGAGAAGLRFSATDGGHGRVPAVLAHLDA